MRIAITPGEPAGIGPEIVVRVTAAAAAVERVIIGDPELLAAHARELDLPFSPYRFDPSAPRRPQGPGEVAVHAIEPDRPVQAGHPDPLNAQYVLAGLRIARLGCLDGTFDALVTGPVHKGVINDAGVPFSGHTEFLAEGLDTPPVMMLATDELRVALVTTHLPLRAVADRIDTERVETVARILERDLRTRFAIAKPTLLILGLNPHAGEGGHLGHEEQDAIVPAIDRLIADGIDARGPLPADTAFTPRHLDTADAVLAMYHDQGLPVVKYAGFGRVVNVTLGLPFVRTSVDHGTALDLAGTGRAEAGSLQSALDLAVTLATRQAAS